MKGFINSRLLLYFLALILIILVACKFFISVTLFKSEYKVVSKKEKAIFLATVVFDLALIPNILVSNSLFALFGAITLVEGLVYTKLVFSIAPLQLKEAI